ncbi:MAG: hypothetical protein U9N85_10200 [Bacteroidota bacterium]|nr:hypothetical protein [Bacteroidota bacterium]
MLRINGTLNINDAYSFPLTDGSANQVLVTDGNDILTWTNVSDLSDGVWTVDGNNIYSAVSGNVGIGTTSPSQKLTIINSTEFTLGGNDTGVDNIYLENHSAGAGDENIGASISFSGPYNGGSGAQRRHAAIVGVQETTETDYIGLAFYTHNSTGSTGDMQESFRISHDGLIGIGTTTPNQPLDVNGDVETGAGDSGYDGFAEIISIRAQSDLWVMGVQNETTEGESDFFIGKNYSEDGTFHIENSGDVGIGITNPTNKLHVVDDYRAVYGTSTTTGNHSYGIYGTAYGGTLWSYGVYGASLGSGGGRIGVFGSASGGTTNYAGYFSGDVNITGSIAKGSGTFKIDHPLDPENKYLYHSFVESPDMMNIYNGNIILDRSGEATVTMPDYFEALNMEFRYQLTAIGAPGPNLYIAKEISGNTFKIAGGTSGTKVSWQVTGIRHDPFANENRVKVEVDKEANDRGKYIHPDAYNQPKEKGIDYEMRNMK